MRHETFFISARDSSHIKTSQGVNCRTFYANVRRPPGPGPGAATARDEPETKSLNFDEPNSKSGLQGSGRRARPAEGAVPSGRPAPSSLRGGGRFEQPECVSAQRRRVGRLSPAPHSTPGRRAVPPLVRVTCGTRRSRRKCFLSAPPKEETSGLGKSAQVVILHYE